MLISASGGAGVTSSGRSPSAVRGVTGAVGIEAAVLVGDGAAGCGGVARSGGDCGVGAVGIAGVRCSAPQSGDRGTPAADELTQLAAAGKNGVDAIEPPWASTAASCRSA